MLNAEMKVIYTWIYILPISSHCKSIHKYCYDLNEIHAPYKMTNTSGDKGAQKVNGSLRQSVSECDILSQALSISTECGVLSYYQL